MFSVSAANNKLDMKWYTTLKTLLIKYVYILLLVLKIIIFQSHLNSFPLDSNAKLIILENVASKSWLVESMKIS